MAPVIDTYPHVSRTYANMSPPPTSSTAFVALTLGRSADAIELSVPPAPAAHAARDLKARSFDFLADFCLSLTLLITVLLNCLLLLPVISLPALTT
jgi:hypothetical protein